MYSDKNEGYQIELVWYASEEAGIWKCLWNEFEAKQNGIETTSRNGVWLPERIKWMETTHLYMESGHVNLFGGLIVNGISVMDWANLV